MPGSFWLLLTCYVLVLCYLTHIVSYFSSPALVQQEVRCGSEVGERVWKRVWEVAPHLHGQCKVRERTMTSTSKMKGHHAQCYGEGIGHSGAPSKGK